MSASWGDMSPIVPPLLGLEKSQLYRRRAQTSQGRKDVCDGDDFPDYDNTDNGFKIEICDSSSK